MRIVTVFCFVFLVIPLAEIQQYSYISSSQSLPCTDLQVGGKTNNDPFMCRRRSRFFVRELSRIWRDVFSNEALMVLTGEIWGCYMYVHKVLLWSCMDRQLLDAQSNLSWLEMLKHYLEHFLCDQNITFCYQKAKQSLLLAPCLFFWHKRCTWRRLRQGEPLT